MQSLHLRARLVTAGLRAPAAAAGPSSPTSTTTTFAAALRAAAKHIEAMTDMNDSKNNNTSNLTVGKYLISPLTQLLENGWYACSVSIRSGSGRGTSDRVVRLTRLFRDKSAAAAYALREGMRWIGQPAGAATV
jgi:hypothetical protein